MNLLRNALSMAALSIAALMGTSTAALAESYRVDANSTSNVELRICEAAVRVSVRGDGDTDLDFTIRNNRGETVHSDFDTTDITYATLRPRSSGCETFDLQIQNIGSVYNMVNVTFETVERGSSSASAKGGDNDGRNRDIAIRNRSGETLRYIRWSKDTDTSYGDDRLGSGVLANGQDWNVTVGDGTGACIFDFVAETASGRTIAQNDIDVCSVSYVTFD
jgi:hypothetical protein